MALLKFSPNLFMWKCLLLLRTRDLTVYLVYVLVWYYFLLKSMTEGKKYAFIESRAYTIKAFGTGIRPEKKPWWKSQLLWQAFLIFVLAQQLWQWFRYVLGAPKPKSRVFCIGDTQTTESVTYHRLERVKWLIILLKNHLSPYQTLIKAFFSLI